MAPTRNSRHSSDLPGAVWQRCQFHLAQNAIHHAPNVAIRKRIGAELRRIWNASSLQTAQEELDRLVTAYRDTADRLADWLEHNVPEGLAVFTLPEPHWRRMRTANPIERAIQQEIKRRTSKVRVFPNRDALLRLATASPRRDRRGLGNLEPHLHQLGQLGYLTTPDPKVQTSGCSIPVIIAGVRERFPAGRKGGIG